MAPKKMGRPTDEPKEAAIHIRLTKDDLERLDYAARETGLTRAAVIRQSVKKFCEELNKGRE